MALSDYVIRVHKAPSAVDAQAWDALLAQQALPSPFMRHAYLAALHDSGSACATTGWDAHFITLHAGNALAAACVVYLKDHSYGEYVFDWAWASAYQQHGVPYYPKAVVAVPFTPVPGTRLLARDDAARAALVQALIAWCQKQAVSSMHLLFGAEADTQACADAGLMLRNTVQFHWKNVAPTLGTGVSSLPPEGAHFPLGRPGGETSAPMFASFDAFLGSLAQDKRKKIRQERRKVAQAGVTFRHSLGSEISPTDWEFFYQCYERTYLEHGNAPYLNRDFFARMAQAMPEHWLLFIAERDGYRIASSLIAVHAQPTGAVAYGRYWGALESVDCLHFEACYYQPLEWCIANGFERFEGGAQGEHKMARALLPVVT
ncbi:MAG: hypothetical protein RL032_277, partial [Pseudomonadota bacterium]